MKKIVFILLALIACSPSKAIVRPAALFNDGMVLQQQSNVRFWGRAKANARVSVKGSWNNRSVSVRSDAEGRWELFLQTPEASFTTYKVTLSDGDKLTINDVLIGEVWFASGQSNMEMPVHGFAYCPTENSTRYIAESDKFARSIRMVSIPRFPLRQPAEFVEATWMKCEPATVRNFSAVGYFFAMQLANKLNCPIGIINNAWGGSRVECWTPRDILESYGNEKLDVDVFKNRANSATPMVMYNGMIKPLAGYNIRGFIWYQSEANVYQNSTYANRFGNMIRQWRKDWKLGELPFLFVEIAPFNYNSGLNAAMLREAQCDVQHQVENTWMVSTNDLVKPYETSQIHPCMKFEVGDRLSMMALNKVYHMKGLVTESPEFTRMEIKDGKAIVYFSHVSNGFNRFLDVKGFEIAGPDNKFVPAEANTRIGGGGVAVSSPEVPNPKAVRYCFKDFAIGNLASGDNLPVIPFRSNR